MNNQQLQDAIDRTRIWLSSQTSSSLTPSLKAKEDAVAYLSELQKIQVTRAGLVSYPKLRIMEKI
jgi:hypothetical protein